MHDESMASDPAEFWQRRDTLAPTTDVPADVGGYQLVLLVNITHPEVRAAYQSVHDTLDRFDCLDPCLPASLHLTIKLFDIAVDRSASMDWSPAVGRTDRIVSEALSDQNPFEATVTQFNLFPDVVYGEVADDGRLGGLNRAVCDHPEVTTLDRDEEEFIPHLTFGYFQSDTDFEALVDFLEANRRLSLPPVSVDEIELAAYELGGRPPAYDQIATYDL